MKIFRNKNGFLYSIEQKGKGSTITPPKDWNHFYAVPFYTNKNAPKIESLGTEPNLTEFNFEFEI